jgi:predicted helicase
MEAGDYKVSKMVFGKKDGKPDKSTIVYNGHVTLREIPLDAYEYVVNGKSAIEWVLERYQIVIEKDSGIKNDPNNWAEESGDPAYILNLVKRLIRVSVESVKIVQTLPHF